MPDDGAFTHLGLFKLPGMDVDQIEVPLGEFPAGLNPEEVVVVLICALD